MNRISAQVLVVAVTFFCLAGPLRAQTYRTDDTGPDLDTDPVTVHSQFVPQYLMQSISNDPRYARIEALIDNGSEHPVCEIVLMDKASGRRTIYSNLEDDAKALQQVGMDAHYTPIKFTALERLVLSPIYRIKLQDRYGQEIVWIFIVNKAATFEGIGFISPLNDSTIVLAYADGWASAAKGTTVTIGGKTEAVQTASAINLDDPESRQALYATGLTIEEVEPTVRLWYAAFSTDHEKQEI